MTKKDYIQIAELLARDYASVSDPRERRGYNLAIQTFIRYSTSANPRFNALKFAAAVYKVTSHSKTKKS